jgi:hypothetical protein
VLREQSVFYWLVTVAAADGADFQMKAGMFRMAAVVDEVFLGLLGRPYLGKDSIDRMLFAVVGTEPALTFMHM